MVAARKGKKKQTDEPITEPFIEDVSLALADRPLPRGLYGNHAKIQLPHKLAAVFGTELVPYLALLHDINLLVREWNQEYRRTLKAVIDKKDYSDLVDTIMARRHERDCPKCGSTDTEQTSTWTPEYDPGMRYYTFTCQQCGNEYRVKLMRWRRRPCALELRGAK